jgi:putative copper export protein
MKDNRENNQDSKYSNRFCAILALIVLTILVSDPIAGLLQGLPIYETYRELFAHPKNLFGFFVLKLPLFILAFMAGRSSLRKNSKKEFVCRSAGILFAYSIYLCWLIYLGILIASGPGAIFGMVLYPLSSPILIPLLYYTGFFVAARNQK